MSRSNVWRRVLAVEVVLAALSGAMFLLTLAWHDWIETIFGFDPDHGNGSLEWGITAGLLLVTIALSVSARITWRRHIQAVT